VNNHLGNTLSGGIEGYFPYRYLIKSMIGHAIIDSKNNDEDYKWLMKSELAELYCEVAGRDINEVRETATKIRESDTYWRYINKKVELADTEIEPAYHPYKITQVIADGVRQDYETSKSQRQTAKKYGISTKSVRDILVGKIWAVQA
jgi:hypothetical protein